MPKKKQNIRKNVISSNVEKRREMAYELLMEGKTRTFILDAVSLSFKCAKKTVEDDLTTCYKYIRENFVNQKENVLADHLTKYYRAYEFQQKIANELYKDGDKRGAIISNNSSIAILKNIENLLYMGKPEINLNTVTNNNTLNVNTLQTNEINDILNVLKQKNDTPILLSNNEIIDNNTEDVQIIEE
jgi:hypothetical protein